MRPNERLAAANLDQFLSAYMEGEPTPPPDNVDPADAACAAELVSLAANIQPDPEFARNLEAQLLSAVVAGYAQPATATPVVNVEQKRIRPSWRQVLRQWIAGGVRTQPVRRSSQVRLTQVVLAIILALMVLPVLGQTILRYFVPQEVDQLPIVGETHQPGEAPQTAIAATMAPTPTTSSLNEKEIEQIEQTFGFPILTPQYVPDGCDWQETTVISEVRAVYLHYECVYIAQQRASGVQHPFVGSGSVEQVEVNGRPAIFTRGGWVYIDGSDTPVWEEDTGSQLVFENGDVIVRIQSKGSIPQEEMIRIAESMFE